MSIYNRAQLERFLRDTVSVPQFLQTISTGRFGDWEELGFVVSSARRSLEDIPFSSGGIDQSKFNRIMKKVHDFVLRELGKYKQPGHQDVLTDPKITAFYETHKTSFPAVDFTRISDIHITNWLSREHPDFLFRMKIHNPDDPHQLSEKGISFPYITRLDFSEFSRAALSSMPYLTRQFPFASSVDFTNSGLTDEQLAKVWHLHYLEELIISGCNVTDAGLLSALADKTEFITQEGLTTLYLDDCVLLTGACLRARRLTSLKNLSLVGCIWVDGDTLKVIKHMPNLRDLDLSQTWVTDDMLYAITDIIPSSLRVLTVIGCNISDDCVAHIRGEHPNLTINLNEYEDEEEPVAPSSQAPTGGITFEPVDDESGDEDNMWRPFE